MEQLTIRVRAFNSGVDGRPLLEFHLWTELAGQRMTFAEKFAHANADDERYVGDEDALYNDGMVAEREILLLAADVSIANVDDQALEGGFLVEPQHVNPMFHQGGEFALQTHLTRLDN